MIKINLLNSVTERQIGAIGAVDRKVSSPATRLVLMSLSVVFLLLAVVGWDVISSQMAKADMEKQLDEQKQIAQELDLNEGDVQAMTSQLRQGLVERQPDVRLDGEVEADEVYVVAGHKGQPAAVAKRGGSGAGEGWKARRDGARRRRTSRPSSA